MNNSFDNTWSSNSSSQWGETGEERLETNQESAFSPPVSQHSQRGSPSHSRISQHETSFGYSPIKLSSSAVETEQNTIIQNNQNRNNSEISQIDKILSQFNSPTSQKSLSRHPSQYSQQSNSFKHSRLSESRSRSQSQNNQQIGSEIEKQKQDQNNQNNQNNYNKIFQIQSDIPEDIQLVDEQQQKIQQEQERNNKNKINIEQNSQQQFELQNELQNELENENENEKNWKDRISEVGSGFVDIIHRVSSGIVSLKDTTEQSVRNSISSLRSQDDEDNINNNNKNNSNNSNNNIVYYDEQEKQWNDETTSNNNIQNNKNYNIGNQQLPNDNQSILQQQQQQVYQQSPIYSHHLQSPIPLTQPRHSSQQQYHSPLIAHEQQQILNQNQQQIQKQQTQQQQYQQIQQQQQQQQNIVNNPNNNINRPTFFDNIKSQVNTIVQKCKISSSKAYNQISNLNNKYYNSLPHYLYFIILFILLILFIFIVWIILRIFQYLLINKNDNEYNQQLRYGYQYQQKSSYQYSDQNKVKQEKKMKNQLQQEYKKEKLKSSKKNSKCIEDIDRIMKLVDKGRKDIEKLVKQQKIGFLCKQSGKCVKIPKGYEYELWDEMNKKKLVNNIIDDNEDEDQEYERDTNDDEIDNYVLPRNNNNNNNKLQSKQIIINNKQQSNNNQYIYIDPINEGITIAGIRSILDSKYGQYICDNQQSIFDYNDFDKDDEQEEKLNLREKRGMKPFKIEIEEEEEQEDDEEIDEQQKINKRKSTKQSYSYKSALKQLDKERINKRENFTEFVNTIIDSIIPDSSVILKMKDSEHEQQTYQQKQTYSSSTNKQMIAQSPNEQYALYFPIPTKKRQQYNPFSYKSSYSHKYHQSSQQQQSSSQYPISYSAEFVLTNNPSLPFTCHVSHYLAKHGTSLFSIFQKLILISIILIILLIIIMIKVKDYKLVNEMYNVVVSTLQVQQLKKMIWLDEQINERKMKKFQNESRKQLNKDEEFEIQISNRSLSSSRNRNVNKQINNKSEAERV